MNTDKFLLSHNDLDGYGCNFTAYRIDPNIRTLNVGYGDVEDRLSYIHNQVLNTGDVKTLYITDLNFEEKHTISLYKMVKNYPNIKFYYIDHHPYQTDRQEAVFNKLKEFNNFKMVHSEKYCASYLFYKFSLSNNLIEFDEAYDKFVSIIDSYDTWKKESKYFKTGLLLNDIFYKWMRQQGRFISYFSQHKKITQEIKDMMKDIMIEKKSIFQECEQTNRIVPFGKTLMAIVDDYVAHITIDYPEYLYYVNGRTYGSVSVRISDLEENPKKIKDGVLEMLSTNPYVESAGGHDRAFGVTLSKEHKDKYLLVVQSIVEHLYQYN